MKKLITTNLQLETNTTNSLATLPLELVIRILEYTDLAALVNLAFTCTWARKFLDNKSLIELLAARRNYPELLSKVDPADKAELRERLAMNPKFSVKNFLANSCYAVCRYHNDARPDPVAFLTKNPYKLLTKIFTTLEEIRLNLGGQSPKLKFYYLFRFDEDKQAIEKLVNSLDPNALLARVTRAYIFYIHTYSINSLPFKQTVSKDDALQISAYS